MTTGVDAETCKLIVLDSNIGSMTEFKQIIGRGTRINEAFGKFYFTIMDFRNVTDKFADPDFDGDPVKVYEPGDDDPVTPPDGEDLPGNGPEPTPLPPMIPGGGPITTGPVRKVYVNGVEVKVLNERVQYYGHDGKLITESLRDYNRGRLRQRFRTLAEFLQSWQSADRKQALLAELEAQGLLLDELQEVVRAKGPALDAFDLICHVAFDQPPLTRQERADNVKKRNYFTRYGEGARKVLEVLLEKYADKGIASIESTKVLELDPLRQMGTPTELIKRFGDKKKYLEAIKNLEDEIYKGA
jgi:type I restriction enzyme R subunit